MDRNTSKFDVCDTVDARLCKTAQAQLGRRLQRLFSIGAEAPAAIQDLLDQLQVKLHDTGAQNSTDRA